MSETLKKFGIAPVFFTAIKKDVVPAEDHFLYPTNLYLQGLFPFQFQDYS